MRHRYYFCPSCAVFGHGPMCWNCGAGDDSLERDSTRIDVWLDWDDEGGTPHRCRPGARTQQPLLTTG